MKPIINLTRCGGRERERDGGPVARWRLVGWGRSQRFLVVVGERGGGSGGGRGEGWRMGWGFWVAIVAAVVRRLTLGSNSRVGHFSNSIEG